MPANQPDLVADLLAGKHRALARAITKIEDRNDGYRDIVSALYPHTGQADVIGITGSPGSGKSTLVDKLASQYRERGLTVGVIAVDPSSPFTGGAVLGDRIRMASTATDMDVFFRSMSARGSLGGLSTATADAVKALDAFGKDKVIIETVGAGQNEVDIVKTADTVAVLVPPSSGDDVQMLKAGILEIGDVFVVNKADLDGANKTVTELRNMLDLRDPDDDTDWSPEIAETVAERGTGVTDLLDVFDAHTTWLDESGRRTEKRRTRYAEELRTLLRADANEVLEAELADRGGVDELVARIDSGATTPYEVAADVLDPIRDALRED
ncbi:MULTISPECIES: methylmalonyl Co-A mutase-associated GTPase MeaB [Halobacterium]|uniref:methylmalonyl Co-A mutase-associated GTPase MeaB n=1 Tax=Halobacterium TaxID=2239 RepID=UPI0019666BFD|nr:MULTISPECIES: methylmalonyl Co-A mutase-associated GTPase MeaB [Halobacterium]MCF2165732.1 methylmalonyl Co-A mutase-associated GTPase MeaB [Halobacterium salinarum]MCF2166602.1 methylmalonyl Co-A mutase-associated GTPase MeaB [Halobacterium salinarum]MCF2207549.1 methylmalonyl Co-A mutase-associated GTPase MeaB [Halobacterium salinarum]MCF2238395.1 methylmalonyl Co-A mutase-associated GTPase MeaB [Halobacterium salinarum]MDL0121354.1 methylmalonyl Co-A mutase-associated GTPase MeaB [Haloba